MININSEELKMDIDGVALKYIEEFTRVYNIFGGTGDLSKQSEFNIFKFIPEDEHKLAYLSFGYTMQSRLEMYDDFREFANILIEKNGIIKFVTARQEQLSKNSALESLARVFGGHNVDVACVNGNQNSKLDTLKESGTKYFVDDRRKTCLELSQNGIICFMPRRRWNNIPEDTPNIIQYDNCMEIYDYFKNMT